MADSLGTATISLQLLAKDFVRGLTQASDGFKRMSGDIRQIGNDMRQGGVALTAFGTALAAPFVLGVKTATEFEAAFVGVTKTVNESDIEGGFGALRESLEDLSSKIPVSFEELSKIMKLSGQMGVTGSKNLLAFTESVARLSDSTELTAEEAALALARIANIFDVADEDFSDFTNGVASAITELGNNFAVTEPEITKFATRLAAAGKAAGFAIEDILGIATAFASVGVAAERGGTAAQKVLLKMTEAVSEGANEANESLTH